MCSSCGRRFDTEGGILALTRPAEDRDYPAPLVDLVADVETRHFWFAARNRVILDTLSRTVGPLRGKRGLDVGCGTGFALAALEAAGLDACGIDMHRAALAIARSRIRGTLFCSSAASLPFFADFDLVTMFDVIEHADDDVALLAQARAALEPGGHLVVTVPADSTPWTKYDEVIGHKRRYGRESLAQALTGAGFEVRDLACFSCLPLLAQNAHRWFSPSEPDAGDTLEIVRRALRVPPEPLNSLLGWSVRAEAPLRRVPWMRGGSLIAVARAA
jgi:SAM-dependent methyltransferase